MKHGFKVWNVKGYVWHESPSDYRLGEDGGLYEAFWMDLVEKLIPETRAKPYFYTGYEHKGKMLCEGDVYYVAGSGRGVVKICPLYGIVFEFFVKVTEEYYELPLVEVLAEDDLGVYLGHIAEGYEV